MYTLFYMIGDKHLTPHMLHLICCTLYAAPYIVGYICFTYYGYLFYIPIMRNRCTYL